MKYEIIDVPQPEDCQKCSVCLRLRLMEMGLTAGEKIEIGSKRMGLWLVNILTDHDDVASTIALRQEELDRICLKGVL